jgi:hypothetical protein
VPTSLKLYTPQEEVRPAIKKIRVKKLRTAMEDFKCIIGFAGFHLVTKAEIKRTKNIE